MKSVDVVLVWRLSCFLCRVCCDEGDWDLPRTVWLVARKLGSNPHLVMKLTEVHWVSHSLLARPTM